MKIILICILCDDSIASVKLKGWICWDETLGPDVYVYYSQVSFSMTGIIFSSTPHPHHHLHRELRKLLNDFLPITCQYKGVHITRTNPIKQLRVIRKKTSLWAFSVTRRQKAQRANAKTGKLVEWPWWIWDKLRVFFQCSDILGNFF